MDETPVDSSWEREAENWVRWVRRPGHDSYWYYRAFFFDVIVPPPGRQTLEVGCRCLADACVSASRIR